MQSYSEYKWFINISEIELGGSSVLGQNYVTFYIVHILAMTLIMISLISCVVVIVSILWGAWQNKNQDQWKRKSRMDFADRFPFYLAVADGLMSISHFVDHLYLVTTHRFPCQIISTVLSINLWIFVGYQQLMHLGLAMYTYMRVVRRVDINLGEGEWKLHGICAIIIMTAIAVFYPIGAFGSSGYWMLQNVRSTGGLLFGIYAIACTSVQSLGTAMAYIQVKAVVERQKMTIVRHIKVDNNKEMAKSHNSTASECLTTFVFISIALYCPVPFIYCAFVVQTMFGVLEPITVVLAVIAANSSGWANTLGYFHNVKIKAAQKRMRGNKLTMATTTCSNGNNSSSPLSHSS